MRRVPYASTIGNLIYDVTCTRSNINHAVGIVSKFISSPSKEHWTTVKKILKYLRDTFRVCLCFDSDKPVL